MKWSFTTFQHYIGDSRHYIPIHGTDFLRPYPADEARKIVSLLQDTSHPAHWPVLEPGTPSSYIRASTNELSRLPFKIIYGY